MIKQVTYGLALACLSPIGMPGQATSTASRSADLQVGGEYVYAQTDYFGRAKKGAGIYVTYDFTRHFGLEFDLRKVESSYDAQYEKTYELGLRYHRDYGRFAPYGKVLYGRGVFNFVSFDTELANLAYNEYVFGGGVDYRLKPWLNLRADYEYQNWMNFPFDGLTPQLVSVGVAYHLPGGMRKGNRFK